MTDSSQTQISYIAESTYGTTPATPAWTKARFVSESLKKNIDNTTSNETRPDRNVTDLVQTGASAGGSVNIELSYGSYDDFLESLFYSTWSTNVLKNGVTQKSFTIEKKFETGATDQYHRLTGAIADSMSLSISSGSLVSGSFGFLAKGMTVAQAEVTDCTYTDANTNPVINAASNFASLAMTGITSPEVAEITLNISNNLRQQPVLGSLDSKGVGAGRFEVTGSIRAYFENEELYDKFLNGEAADLSFTLGGASELNYDFDLPNIKFSDGEVLATGSNDDVYVNLQFQALYDSSDDCTIKVTRTPGS